MIRNLAVWSVTLALLAGSWLPMTARFDAIDADGVCGPSLVFPQSVGHVQTAQAAPKPNHCTACHLRHDLAGAFVSSIVQVVLPADARRTVGGRPMRGPAVVAIDSTAPRGPPAVS